MRGTLARGCQSCIRAKKRCSRALPGCSRCTQKRLECLYQNAPGENPGSRQRVTQRQTKVNPVPNSQTWPGGLPNQRRVWSSHRGEVYWSNGQSLLRMTEPIMFLPMDPESHAYIVHGLVSYPLQFRRKGATLFIHPQAYQRFQPASLHIMRDICRIRLDRPASLSAEASLGLERLVQTLLSTANSTVSFVDTLAFVQCICLLQIMALFSPSSTAEEHAEGLARQNLLIEWTHRLWKTAPSELPSILSRHEAYVLAEAVRRTILTSHKIQCSYRVAKTGFFRHTLFVETLPFGGDPTLWESGQLDDAMRTTYPQLLSYRELCDAFDANRVNTATPFETMLLVGCKGRAAVEKRLGASMWHPN